MKRTLLASLAAASLVAFAAPALAQKPAKPDDNVSYKSKTVYDFDDDVVEGDLVRPDGEFVDTRKAPKHSSLIKILEHFINVLLNSPEDIYFRQFPKITTLRECVLNDCQLHICSGELAFK